MLLLAQLFVCVFFFFCIPVTFSSEVTIFEAGEKSVVITGDKLNQLDYLIRLVTDKGMTLGSKIKDAKKALHDILFGLEEKGISHFVCFSSLVL